MSRRVDEAETTAVFGAALRDHEQAFGTFFWARLLDLDIRYEGDEVCIVEMPVRGFAFNPQGSVHGGIIASVLDISMGHLIHHRMGRSGATVEMKVSYLRPASEGRLRTEGRSVREGRRIAFMESRMVDDRNRLVATATATWAMPEPAPGQDERQAG